MKRLVRAARKLGTAQEMARSTAPDLPESCQGKLNDVLVAHRKLEESVLEEIGKAPPLSRRTSV